MGNIKGASPKIKRHTIEDVKHIQRTLGVSFAIIGSRKFTNEAVVRHVFVTFILPCVKRVVSGGAKGADTLGVQIACAHSVPTLELKPAWRRVDGTYNPRAGFDRNIDIINAADAIWAFWDLHSNGTFDSIKQAIQVGKPVYIATMSNVTFQLHPQWYPSQNLFLILDNEYLSLDSNDYHINIRTVDELKSILITINKLKFENLVFTIYISIISELLTSDNLDYLKTIEPAIKSKSVRVLIISQ